MLLSHGALVSAAHAVIFTVTNGNDAGPGSLRQALLDASSLPGPDQINFSAGFKSIAVNSPLPPITDVWLNWPSAGNSLSINGALVLSTGGQLGPASGSSLLNTGTLNLQSGSTLRATINLGTGTSDRVNVAGTISIDPGATLHLQFKNAPPSMQPRTFIIMTNDGADPVSGSWLPANISSPFPVTVHHAFIGIAENGIGTGNEVAVTVSIPPSGAIRAILSNHPGLHNNSIPTVGGAFAQGTTPTFPFAKPFLSPDGRKWILRAAKHDPSDPKDLVVLGSGMTAAATVAVEDSPASFDPSRSFDGIDFRMAINNSGHYCFGGDLSGPTSDDEVLVLSDGTVQVPVVREGEPSPLPGSNTGSTIDSVHLLNDGTPRYFATLSSPASKRILVSGSGTVLAETDVTIPAGQLIAPNQTIDFFYPERFASSADGTRHMYQGILNGPLASSVVVVLDGAVIAQQGAALPGGVLGSLPVYSFFNSVPQMSPSGAHWACRATMTDDTEVILKNGAVVARTHTPIAPGAAERWDNARFPDTFLISCVNDHGDMVIGGFVNHPDPNRDVVLLHRSAGGESHVLLREGDPVDLNSNGLLDDDAFVSQFDYDGGALSPTGELYLVASIRNAAGVGTGAAFLVVRPNPPVPCYPNCDQSTGSPLLTANDFQCFLNKYAAGDTYANCDGSTGTPTLTANDFQCFLNKYAAGCS